MDSLNQSLLTLFTYISFPHVPGEPIEVEMILHRLLELNLLSKNQIQEIYEVIR
jgi:hypothetical protein